MAKEDRLRKEIACYFGSESKETKALQKASARLQGIMFAKENLKKRHQFFRDYNELLQQPTYLLHSLEKERTKILSSENPKLFKRFINPMISPSF